jgi:2-dehydropantoate 2-reductase
VRRRGRRARRELGVQDLSSSPSRAGVAQVAQSIGPLLGPETIVLPAMNGVPWFFDDPSFLTGTRLESVDPAARLPARCRQGT